MIVTLQQCIFDNMIPSIIEYDGNKYQIIKRNNILMEYPTEKEITNIPLDSVVKISYGMCNIGTINIYDDAFNCIIQNEISAYVDYVDEDKEIKVELSVSGFNEYFKYVYRIHKNTINDGELTYMQVFNMFARQLLHDGDYEAFIYHHGFNNFALIPYHQ